MGEREKNCCNEQREDKRVGARQESGPGMREERSKCLLEAGTWVPGGWEKGRDVGTWRAEGQTMKKQGNQRNAWTMRKRWRPQRRSKLDVGMWRAEGQIMKKRGNQRNAWTMRKRWRPQRRSKLGRGPSSNECATVPIGRSCRSTRTCGQSVAEPSAVRHSCRSETDA